MGKKSDLTNGTTKRSSGWPTLLIYISLVFLLLALYRADYLHVPVIHSPLFLVLSLLLLTAGLLLQGYCWYVALRLADVPIDAWCAIASELLPVFSKYIPGKVWMILGPAGYVQQSTGQSLKKISNLSIQVQLMSIWTGLLVGLLALFQTGQWQIYLPVLLVFWLFLTVTAFSRFFHDIGERLLLLVFRHKISLPTLSWQRVCLLLPWVVARWVLWAAGFQCLTIAMTGQMQHILVGCSFALAAVLGLMAFICPGGLGVREWILADLLMHAGLDLKQAATVAVASRLWFLIGETLAFMIGVLSSSKHKQMADSDSRNEP